MVKRRLSILCLLLAVLMLVTACGNRENFQPATSITDAPTNEPTNAPTQPSDSDPDEDELARQAQNEENMGADFGNDGEAGTTYPFTGATPMRIDPIDKPKPTEAPALEFEYEKDYTVAELGIKFSAPRGWDITIESDRVVMKDVMRDGVVPTLEIIRTPKNQDFDLSAIKTEIDTMISTTIEINYTEFTTTRFENRAMLNADGAYKDYRGKVPGTEYFVRGRILMVCVDRVLYTAHILSPAQFNSSYTSVHRTIRQTLKLN